MKALKKKCLTISNNRITKKFTKLFGMNRKHFFFWWSFQSRRIKYFSKTCSYQINWKKDKDKQLIKNWRPISLLKVDTKSVSNILAEHLKTALPSLISSNQTTYLKCRFTSGGGRLICDIFEVSDFVKIEWTFTNSWYWKSFSFC